MLSSPFKPVEESRAILPDSPENDTQDRSNTLHVGLFTDSYPPVVNGVSTSVYTLAHELERAGHVVSIFAPRFPGHSDGPKNIFRVPSVLTPFERQYPLPLPVVRRLMGRVREEKLDIVHSQSPFLMGQIALHAARRFRLPLVATNHTLYTEYSHYVPVAPESVTKGATRLIVRWYYQQCDALITPSQMAASRLRQEYEVSRPPIAVIPSGIPLPGEYTEEEKSKTKSRLGLPGLGAPMLLYVGRVAKEKNLGMLLDAFEEEISPAEPEARLVIVGSGPDFDAIRQRVHDSARLRSRVILTGFLERSKVDPIYAAADLFVFPSCTETQGMVSGEALAAGTPCVVVDEGGSPETVTDGIDGLLTPNDKHLFAKAALSLIRDPARREEMGCEARRRAAERTPERMAEKVVEVYRQALATSGTAKHFSIRENLKAGLKRFA